MRFMMGSTSGRAPKLEEKTVSIHPHCLVRKKTETTSGIWQCDGGDICRRGISDYQTQGIPRFTCSEGCNYDLCDKCVSYFSAIEKEKDRKHYKSVVIHEHSLSRLTMSDTTETGWFCDGRDYGCHRTESMRGNAVPRYQCTEGCDFDLCDFCINKHAEPPKIVSIHLHYLYRCFATEWRCDGRNTLCGCKAGSDKYKMYSRYRCD